SSIYHPGVLHYLLLLLPTRRSSDLGSPARHRSAAGRAPATSPRASNDRYAPLLRDRLDTPAEFHAPRPARHYSAFLARTDPETTDRKSTRLNSSHVKISYTVFCLKN